MTLYAIFFLIFNPFWKKMPEKMRVKKSFYKKSGSLRKLLDIKFYTLGEPWDAKLGGKGASPSSMLAEQNFCPLQ